MGGVQELVGIVPWTFVAQICNLFLTVYLMKKFLFGRVNRILEQRREITDAQLTEAAKAREDAQIMREQYEQDLGSAKEEARLIITEAQKSAQQKSEAILADAKKEAIALKEKAAEDIAKERAETFREMKAEIGDIAVSIAGRVIEKEVKEEDHRKLIDQFITDVGEAS